jgi:hypothetical protein
VIEVKMTLFDAFEVQLLAQLQQVIEQKRAQQVAPRDEGRGPDGVPLASSVCNICGLDTPHSHIERSPAPSGSVGVEPTVDATYEADAKALNTLADDNSAPAFDPAVAPPVPSDIEVARAITTYATTKGIPAARELLTEFGVKNVTALPDEQRAAFLAKAAV